MEFWDLFDYLCAKKGVSRRKACEDMGFSASLASKGKYADFTLLYTNGNITSDILPFVHKRLF